MAISAIEIERIFDSNNIVVPETSEVQQPSSIELVGRLTLSSLISCGDKSTIKQFLDESMAPLEHSDLVLITEDNDISERTCELRASDLCKAGKVGRCACKQVLMD